MCEVKEASVENETFARRHTSIFMLKVQGSSVRAGCASETALVALACVDVLMESLPRDTFRGPGQDLCCRNTITINTNATTREIETPPA